MKEEIDGIWIPREVWENSHLSSTDKILYGLLHSFKDITRSEMLKLSKKYLNTGRQATINCFKNLEKNNLLIVERFGIGKEIVINVKEVN